MQLDDHPHYEEQNEDGTWTCTVGWSGTVSSQVAGLKRSFTANTRAEAEAAAIDFLVEMAGPRGSDWIR